MSGRRRHAEDSNGSPSSYPHEVAKRIWEDMRMAKRRPRGTPDNMGMSVGVERTSTASQAASQFRNSISRIAWDVRPASPNAEESRGWERDVRRRQMGPDSQPGNDESDTSDSRLNEDHLRRKSSMESRGREKAVKPRGRERNRAERVSSGEDRKARDRMSRHMARHSSMPAVHHDRSDDDSMHIMWADITPAPRDAPVRSSSPGTLRLSSSLGLSEHNPKWSNPNAIEARMLGVATAPAESTRRKMRGDEVRIRLGHGYQTGALSDSTTGESDSEGGTSLPEEISELLRVIGRGSVEEQEEACEVLRSIIHQGGPVAGLMSREQKALETLARGLIGESERARVSTASCFRYLALEAPACACILRSTTILPALVYALKNGSPSAQHKAAAALGNLAWRDDATRERMLSTFGLIASLLSLLWDAGEKGKASSLAALANLSMNDKCAAEVARNIGTLDMLAHELQDGTDKAQVRAAGILRNIAATKAGSDAIAQNEATLRALKAMAERALEATGDDDGKPLRREASLRAVAALSFVSNPAEHDRSAFQEESPWPEARQLGDSHRRLDDQSNRRSHIAESIQSLQRDLQDAVDASPHAKGRAMRTIEAEPSSQPPEGADDGRFELQRQDDREASPPPISASALSLNALASFQRPPSGAAAANYALPSVPPSRTSSSTALVFPHVFVDAARDRPAAHTSDDQAGRWDSDLPRVGADADAAHNGHAALASDVQEAGNDSETPVDVQPQLVQAGGLLDEPFVKIDLVESSFQPLLGRPEAPAHPPLPAMSVKDMLASFSGGDRSAANTSEWNEHAKGTTSQPSSADRPQHERKPAQETPQSAPKPASGGMPPKDLTHTRSVQVGTPPAGERYHGQTPQSQGSIPSAPTPAQAEAPKLRLDEESAVQLLQDWLSKNGWANITSALFEAVQTDMSRYKIIEEDMEDLDPQEGIYSYQGHILRLTGQDRYHPLELIDDITGDVWWDARTEQKALHPWAKKHFMLSPYGEHKILLKRTGHTVIDWKSVPARAPAEHEAATASAHSGNSYSNFVPKSKSTTSGNGFIRNENIDAHSDGHGIRERSPLGSNPTLWRQIMNEAKVDPEKAGEMSFRGRLLSLPKEDKTGSVVVRDLETGEIVYKGPGQHEVFPPKGMIGPCRVQSELVAWVAMHGWHDLQGRLLDTGTTDYSAFANIDREMQPIPGMPNLYNYKGRTLQLVGDSRRMPQRLVDYQSQQVIWDKDSNTKWHHVWARQSLILTRNNDTIVLVDTETGLMVVSLELASHRTSPGVDMSDDEAGRRLMEWTRANGWHNLQRRLFDFVDVDFTTYAKFEHSMIAMPGTTNIYEMEGRQLRLDGHRHNPVKLTDVSNGVVLWERESNSTVKYPWAKAALVWRSTVEGFAVLSNNTGAKLVEVFGGKQGSDTLLYQAILMDGVPMAKIRGLEGVKGIKSLVQVTKEYKPEARAEGFLAINEGDVIFLTSQGENGWAYGRLVLEKAGKTFFDNKDATVGWGSAGWYPNTFAMPLLEMSKWNKRVLHVHKDPTGPVTVTDALSGETLYSGSGSLPRVEWHIPTSSSPRAQQGAHQQEPLQNPLPAHQPALSTPAQPQSVSPALAPCVRFSTPDKDKTGKQGTLAPFVNMSSFEEDVSEREIPPISPVSPSLSFASVSMPSSSPSPIKRSFLPSSETNGGVDKDSSGGDGRGTPVAVSPVAAGALVKSSPFRQQAAHGFEKVSSLVKSSPFSQAEKPSHSPEKAAVSSLIKSSPFIQQDSPPPGRTTPVIGRKSSFRFGAGASQSATGASPSSEPRSIIEQRKAELSSSIGGSGRPSPVVKAQGMSVRGLQHNLGATQAAGAFGKTSSGWKFNRDLFYSIGGQGWGLGIAAKFSCQKANAVGAAKEEALELHTAGAFVYATQHGSVWVILRGSYRLAEASRGGGLSDLIMRVESKSTGSSRSAAQQSGGESVEGVYVRGRATRESGGGDFAHVDWVSGHEEVGMGGCKAKLSRS